MDHIFLIDVDDVLINTPALKTELEQHATEGQDLQDPALLKSIEKEKPGFLKTLVYEHGRDFLEQYQGRCVLISSAKSSKSEEDANDIQMEYQRLKIKLCGLTELVGGEEFVKITRGEKTDPLQEFANRDALFIDNDIKHLRTAHGLGIETAHLFREHLRDKGFEGASEYFREAKYGAENFEELISQLEAK